MKLTVTTVAGEVIPLEVPDEMELENFLALCQCEVASLPGVVGESFVLVHEGKPLIDRKKTLKNYHLKDGDMVMLVPKSPGFDPSQSNSAGSSRSAGGINPQQMSPAQMLENPEIVREMLLKNPGIMATLRERNPHLAEALDSGDIGKFKQILQDQLKHQMELDQMRIRAFNNPFDVEAQSFIENEIHQENIQNILEAAIEHTPESFGLVCMLYIRCKVNGHDIKAFVDSGAQSTIMSSACAQRCSIMRLVDKRFQGIAKGVGTQKIIGRIHMAQLQIEKDFLPTSFTVLEDQQMDMLLGLDMLKRHQCIIDLKRGVLTIGTTGTETKFLPENELPAHARQLSAEDGMFSEEDALQKALDASARDAQARASTSSGSNPSKLGVSSESVKELVAMGFDEASVVRELRRASGDKNAAAAALLAKSIKAPPRTH